jgi:hypothetical protein
MGTETVFGALREAKSKISTKIVSETRNTGDSVSAWVVGAASVLLFTLVGATGWLTSGTWKINDHVNTGLVQLNRLEHRQ